jgi:transposase
MQVEGLDTTVVDYINEIKANYEQQIQSLNIQIQTLKNSILGYKNDIIEYKNNYLLIKERLDLLTYQKFGRSAEQMPADDKQRLLFTEEDDKTETAVTEERTEVKSYLRKKGGRKPLSPDLPREIQVIDIPESEKTCACGAKLTKIGEETSERLHIVPQSIRVIKTVRPKYACRHCEGTEDEEKATVRIAPVEPSMIPRSIASPSLLSTVFTYKFERHLPYYRQEKMYEQIGADISRQDMSNWQQQVFEKLSPLFVRLKETVKEGPVLQMDETTVQVIGEKDRTDTQKSYMWLSRGGPPGKRVIWYEYHPTRGGCHARDFLQGYCGYLQTDGYDGYDSAVKGRPDIIHVGCFAHARRKFFEASKISSKSRSAGEGIKHIRLLYELEDELRGLQLADDDFLLQRKARAGPILEKFKAWLEKRKDETLGSGLLGKAVGYSLSQWEKMVAYLESPYLTPDNNACENAIRPFVLGRKNWLFNQCPEGAESSCGMYTLIETAKENGLVPLGKTVPHRFPQQPASQRFVSSPFQPCLKLFKYRPGPRFPPR